MPVLQAPGIGLGMGARTLYFLGISSQNVGNGVTHLLRLRAIRATL
jgi:hypothetical protein